MYIIKQYLITLCKLINTAAYAVDYTILFEIQKSFAIDIFTYEIHDAYKYYRLDYFNLYIFKTTRLKCKRFSTL